MTRTIPVDIEGLNLVLGGGVPVLKRHATFDESATLLVRGPPGSGKTILGVQLAGSLARSLGADVAYGCIELLPTELAAQHAGIKRDGVMERVVTAPFEAVGASNGECRIFAEMLDLGGPGEEVAGLDDAIEQVLGAIAEAGGKPRVMVIDSLSDGYGLGAEAPRVLADALCKMAARRGMILVLLEETVDATPSAWSFATDVVVELSGEQAGDDGTARVIRVRKNRLGPAASGAHRFGIAPGSGITVMPHPHAYAVPWAPRVLFGSWNAGAANAQDWTVLPLPATWPLFRQCVTAVHGGSAAHVRLIASWLGVAPAQGDRMVDGFDVWLDFSAQGPNTHREEGPLGRRVVVSVGYPYMSMGEMLAYVVEQLRSLSHEQARVRRVIAGDLSSLRSFRDGGTVRAALNGLASLLRVLGIPTVLFESDLSQNVDVRPPSADFADVVLFVSPGEPPNVLASCDRFGLSLQQVAQKPRA